MQLEIKRQGDILFIRLPQDDNAAGKKVKREGGRLILARGETTGHAHAVADKGVALKESTELSDVWENFLREIDFDVDYVKTQPVRWLEAPTPFEVVHEEHAAIGFEPGQVLVLNQREYTPEAVRRVLD